MSDPITAFGLFVLRLFRRTTVPITSTSLIPVPPPPLELRTELRRMFGLAATPGEMAERASDKREAA